MTELTAEQRRLVERAAPSVAALARVLSYRMPHVSVDDLRSAGYEGLVHAATRFDPSEGVPFRAFAHYRVRGAMIDAARRAEPNVRRRTRAQRALEASQALLEQAQKAHGPTDSAEQRTLKERVQAASDLVAQLTTAVLVSKIGPRDPDTISDAQRDDALDAIIEGEAKRALHEAIDESDEEDRAMIKALYFEGASMGDFARSIGKNKSTVSRRHARVLERLGARLRRRLEHLSPADTPPGPDS